MAPFLLTVNERTELRLIGRPHGEELFKLLDSNREHLRYWHPWVDSMHSVADVEKIIEIWVKQFVNNKECYTGIWFEGQLCGMVNYVCVDWSNRWTALSYWLDAAHQGQGIMTASCQTMISYGYNKWKFNRISIECATQNARSRAIPERLGFKLEGIIRGIEWLQDHYVDHAMYGLLRSDYANGLGMNVPAGK